MNRPYGIVARFDTAEALLATLRRLRAEGYERLEVFTPFPLEEALELVPHRRSPVPLIMLGAGICGAVGGFLLQVWASTDYSVQVAGRPLFSWPAFVPVTFELTVLTASFCGLAGFLLLARLPRLDHPVFKHRDFDRASQDAFFAAVLADDPRFEASAVTALLQTAGAQAIEEVER